MTEKVEELRTKLHELQIEIERLRGDSNTKDQELRRDMAKDVGTARNQALAIFGFIAVLAGLGLFNAIEPIVVRVVEESASGDAAAQAAAHAERANSFADEAEGALQQIEAGQTEWSAARQMNVDELLNTFSTEFDEQITVQQSGFDNRLAEWSLEIADATGEAAATAARIENDASGRIAGFVSQIEETVAAADEQLQVATAYAEQSETRASEADAEFERLLMLTGRIDDVESAISELRGFVAETTEPISGSTCGLNSLIWQSCSIADCGSTEGADVFLHVEFDTPRLAEPDVSLVLDRETSLFFIQAHDVTAFGFTGVISSSGRASLSAAVANNANYCFDWIAQ